MKVLRLGGSGGMGRYAVRVISKFPELEAITIADLNEEAAKEFGLYLLESTRHNQPFYEKYGFVKIGEEMRQSL